VKATACCLPAARFLAGASLFRQDAVFAMRHRRRGCALLALLSRLGDGRPPLFRLPASALPPVAQSLSRPCRPGVSRTEINGAAPEPKRVAEPVSDDPPSHRSESTVSMSWTPRQVIPPRPNARRHPARVSGEKLMPSCPASSFRSPCLLSSSRTARRTNRPRRETPNSDRIEQNSRHN